MKSKNSILNSSIGSKGNQEKGYIIDTNSWYKLDQFGFEALSEYVVSELLKQSNEENYVEYTIDIFNVQNNKNIFGCVSKNFLELDEVLYTIPRLCTLLHYDYDTLISSKNSTSDKILKLIEFIENHTKLHSFKQHLSNIIYLDSVIYNYDRHLNNLAVIYNTTDKAFRNAPIFDNGSALLSNEIDFPYNFKSERKYISELTAKPFDKSFEKQFIAMEQICPHTLKFNNDFTDVINLVENTPYGFYPKERVKSLLKSLPYRIEYLDTLLPLKGKTNFF